MSLVSGARLGIYEIRAIIGAGGMGEVYRAHDSKLGREVAIKILPEPFASDADRLARFEREARVLASLNHPNIAAIYGIEDTAAATHAGASAAVHALVLELVDGQTLAERLADGAIPFEETLAIARQIADALDAAHEKGIVHRDLKPANIKVKPDGTVKVLDFGLAKALDPSGSDAPHTDQSLSPTFMQTSANARVLIGTAAYMSPEQARGRSADKRSDIWAFGCVLHEMLTGRAFFAAGDVSDTLAFVLTKEPDWNALPPATPAAVRRLLRRCLAKDRNRRLADISDARLDLAEAVETAPGSAAQTGASRSSVAPWIVATIAGLLAIGLAVPALRYLRQPVAEAFPTHLEITTPPTSDSISFALSPDGRAVAFVAVSEGVPRLWIRSLDQTAAQALIGTDGASYPFWSPDSRSIGFFADGKLKRIDRAGGTAIALADASGGRGGAWSREDVIVFAPGPTTGLMRVPAGGGTATPVTRLAGIGSHRWPQFLPDDHHFLFMGALTTPEKTGAYIASLDGGQPRFVVNTDTAPIFVAPEWLLIARQGVLTASHFDPSRGIVGSEVGTVAQGVGLDAGLWRSAAAASATALGHRTGGSGRRLQWFDRSGARRGDMSAPDDNVLAYPELALDDRHLAIRRTVLGNMDLWVWDMVRGVQSRFTSDPALDNMAVWSPDAQTLVFESNRKTGTYDLYEKPASGGSEGRLLLASAENKDVMS